MRYHGGELKEERKAVVRIFNTLELLLGFRWHTDLKDLKVMRIKLLGDCLLCSAFLSYVGAFSWEFRSDLVYDKWITDIRDKEIPMSDNFKLENILTNDVEISK